METEERKHQRAELAARAAGAAIQHGLGEDVVETGVDPGFLQRRDSVAKEVAEVAVKKGLIKGEDLAPVTFAQLHAVALDAASAAIQKGMARDECEPEVTETQKSRLQELSILAASSAMQHHFGEDIVDTSALKKVSSLAEAAADAAIQRKLVPDERHDPTLDDLAEVARHAASAAIQKLLAAEDRAVHDAEHDHERQKVATLVASAALQQGHGFERPSVSTLRTLSDISKSAAEAALKKTAQRPADVDENDFKTAQEVAQFAIDHQLIDHPEPPSELVAEVARMAAGAAIQRGLADEAVAEGQMTERKGFLATVARNAASFAIQRGLGAEVVPNRRRAYELAVLAASAAMRRQEQIAEERHRVHPNQIAEVARQAAQEAVRLGYGHDESDVMVMPKTPPAEDNISAAKNPHDQTTDIINKEQSGGSMSSPTAIVYREAEIEHTRKPSFCGLFSRLTRSKRSSS